MFKLKSLKYDRFSSQYQTYWSYPYLALRQVIIANCLALEKNITVAIENHMKLILSSFPNPITYAKNISIRLIDIGWWQSLKKC